MDLAFVFFRIVVSFRYRVPPFLVGSYLEHPMCSYAVPLFIADDIPALDLARRLSNVLEQDRYVDIIEQRIMEPEEK